jgi:hypothetical protein
VWLTGRLTPDHKTIADFRKDNGRDPPGVLALRRAVPHAWLVRRSHCRDRWRRLAKIEESVARYLHQLDSADRQEPSPARTTKMSRLKDKIVKLKEGVLSYMKYKFVRHQTSRSRLPIPQCGAFLNQGLDGGTTFVSRTTHVQ